MSTDYTFDIVAVATIHIGAPDYATARCAAEAVQEFNVRDNAVDEGNIDAAGITYELTYVTPRGKASYVDSDPVDESVPPEDEQTLPEPLVDDARDVLKAALDEADEALGGNSNDAEHDALYSVRETIAGLLSIDYDPPSPYGDGEDDEDDDSPDPGGDGFVTLGRNDWEIRLEGIVRGCYPKYEMAVYQLARVMAETGSFPACWAEGEHGPSSRLIDDEVRAFHDAGSDQLLPLPGARFSPGDLVIDADGGWPCQVIFDYGDIGVHVHAQGDPDVTAIVPPARLVSEDRTGVHAAHCCREHGCKYGDAGCPVVLGAVEQDYPCGFCESRDEDAAGPEPAEVRCGTCQAPWTGLRDTECRRVCAQCGSHDLPEGLT